VELGDAKTGRTDRLNPKRVRRTQDPVLCLTLAAHSYRGALKTSYPRRHLKDLPVVSGQIVRVRTTDTRNRHYDKHSDKSWGNF